MANTTRSAPAAFQVEGRRYTRRKVEGGLVEIDWDEVLRVDRYKDRALSMLDQQGINARAYLEVHPGGSALLDYVINYLEHPSDSAAGLAARIAEGCIHLDQLLKENAGPRPIAAAAFALGRLVTLAKVYGIDDADALQRSARSQEAARMPRRKLVDHEEVEHEFRRLLKQGKTQREARGILVLRGLASKATIHRITKGLISGR